MFQPLSLFIGLRYTRAKRRNRFISFISFASMAGIAIGVIAMLVVMSVMNGFEREIQERTLRFTAHANLAEFDGRLKDWQKVREQVIAHPRIQDAAPYVQGEGMITAGTEASAVMLKGIDPELETKVSGVADYLQGVTLDALQAGSRKVILGRGLADKLGVEQGDHITVLAPRISESGMARIPVMHRYHVAGLFDVGMREYDNNVAFAHIDDAAALWGLEHDVTGLRLQMHNVFEAAQVSYEVALNLGGAYLVSDWTRQHRNFFRALGMQKRMLFLILFLIVAVAAFNIVSTLVMAVTDKQADIAIMRSMGSSRWQVMRIFLVQGSLIGLFGVLIGVVFGLLLAMNLEALVPWLDQITGQSVLTPGAYFLDALPSEILFADVMAVAMTAFVTCVLAGLYPAWRASNIQPAEALRYE